MMTPEKIIIEAYAKYGEWLEIAGEKSPQLMINILASMLIKEREQNAYLQRRLDHVGINTRV